MAHSTSRYLEHDVEARLNTLCALRLRHRPHRASTPHAPPSLQSPTRQAYHAQAAMHPLSTVGSSASARAKSWSNAAVGFKPPDSAVFQRQHFAQLNGIRAAHGHGGILYTCILIQITIKWAFAKQGPWVPWGPPYQVPRPGLYPRVRVCRACRRVPR